VERKKKKTKDEGHLIQVNSKFSQRLKIKNKKTLVNYLLLEHQLIKRRNRAILLHSSNNLQLAQPKTVLSQWLVS
jgi:hypothetical protein